MGCCLSTETETVLKTQTPQQSTRNVLLHNDMSSIIDTPLHPPKPPVDTGVLTYEQMVINASEEAKKMDENIETMFKNKYRSILYEEYGQTISPELSFYLSSDTEYEETSPGSRSRAHSQP